MGAMAAIVRDAPETARSADGYEMSTISPAAPIAVASGVLALVVALLAVLTDTGWMVGLAAVLAVASALLVVLRPSPRRVEPAATDVRPAVADLDLDPGLAEPQPELDAEARAAAERFEADAIRSREELIRELTSRPREDLPSGGAGGGTDLETQPVVDLSAPIDLTPPADLAESVAAPAAARPPEGPGDAADDEVVHDVVTGLFSQVFFEASLEKRVSASRRGLRPLSVAVIEVEVDVTGPEPHTADPHPVAEAMVAVFRDADTVARDDAGLFLVLLEDTPENGAVWCLERLRRRISETMPGHTTRAGLSCYPAYGFSGPQLVAQARAALELAREWPQDRIEVTAESPD